MSRIPDELWIRHVLDSAEDVTPARYIDAEYDVRRGEEVLGEVGHKVKQFFTVIRRLERKRAAHMGRIGEMAHAVTREQREEKKKALNWGRHITWHLEILKMILLQQLQETFGQEPNTWIVIRKGFLAVRTAPPRRPVLHLVRGMWN